MVAKQELEQAWEKFSPEQRKRIRDAVLMKRAKTDLAAFGEYVFGHQPAHHHQQIIDFLQKYPNENLLIVAPPRHAKTTWVGVIYPTFQLMQHPEKHIIYISATIDQATNQSLQIRDTIQNNERFQEICPDIKPALTRQWTKTRWTVRSPRFKNDKDPTFITSGNKGNILGATGDEIIIDDLNDEKNTATPYMREVVQNWVVRTVMTRLSPTGRIVCIMTRWHAGDLAGYFKKIGWKTLELQAIGCGGCILDHFHRPKNEPLWPDLWPLERLLKTKSGMDMWQWEGVYQANPTPLGGTIWKEEWWRYYAVGPQPETEDENDQLPKLPNEFDFKIQSWDCSQKTGEENDYSACSTWGYYKGNYYLLDAFKKKMEYPELKAEVKRLYAIHRPGAVLVEDASSGSSLVQELPIETSIPIIPIKVEADKQARARAASWAAQAGRIYLPQSSSYIADWIREHSDFPQGNYRDQCDATSQAILWLRQNTSQDEEMEEALEYGKGRSVWSLNTAEFFSADDFVADGLSRWNRFGSSIEYDDD